MTKELRPTIAISKTLTDHDIMQKFATEMDIYVLGKEEEVTLRRRLRFHKQSKEKGLDSKINAILLKTSGLILSDSFVQILEKPIAFSIPCIYLHQLKDKEVLTHFLTFIYTFSTFQTIKASGNRQTLGDFQTKSKYLFMAHHQSKTKELGRIIATQKKYSQAELMEHYEVALKKLLSRQPTKGDHVNTCMHIMGYFKNELTQGNKKELLSMMKEYKNNRISLQDILGVLRELSITYDKSYLQKQFYFQPYPAHLNNINDY